VDAKIYAMASKSSGGRVDLPGFFADLVRCETRLYNALNDRLRERHGIVTSQFEFLRFLRDHPGSRVADLAAEFAIGIGATSKGIDRLEKQAWVIRRTNPSDRRSSLLAPQHWPPYRSFRSSAPFSNGIRSACPQADRHVHTVRSPADHVISLCCEANPAD
jgi:hypothetical protein